MTQEAFKAQRSIHFSLSSEVSRYYRLMDLSGFIYRFKD